MPVPYGASMLAREHSCSKMHCPELVTAHTPAATATLHPPDGDATRHTGIQPTKFEATESLSQLLVWVLRASLAGQLLPGFRGPLLEGGGGAGL